MATTLGRHYCPAATVRTSGPGLRSWIGWAFGRAEKPRRPNSTPHRRGAARSPRELAEHPYAGVECPLKRPVRLGAECASGLQVKICYAAVVP